MVNNGNMQFGIINYPRLSNIILALKFVKFLTPKEILFKTLILLLKPSVGPFEYGTSSEFFISQYQC